MAHWQVISTANVCGIVFVTLVAESVLCHLTLGMWAACGWVVGAWGTLSLVLVKFRTVVKRNQSSYFLFNISFYALLFLIP